MFPKTLRGPRTFWAWAGTQGAGIPNGTARVKHRPAEIPTTRGQPCGRPLPPRTAHSALPAGAIGSLPRGQLPAVTGQGSGAIDRGRSFWSALRSVVRPRGCSSRSNNIGFALCRCTGSKTGVGIAKSAKLRPRLGPRLPQRPWLRLGQKRPGRPAG